ncbi:S8 family serine peptidase [uncultured Bacteroides sp.]|uniref:S8 family peptidase n=1 Tax=uncultured Bacteroides sp. TaxID=162156 RepID=UPI0025EF9A6C|nr:S8 family serine peptidase [uncultured Bacteroides sp.]
MKKLITSICFAAAALGVSAQFAPGDSLKYRISLRDKAATEYSLQKPERYLSAKSIERRKRQGLAIDSTDLPVCRKYVDAIRNTGVRVLVTGKWDNFVTVSCNDAKLIDEVAKLSFVRSTERVWKGREQQSHRRDSLINRPLRSDSLYGPAARQIKMSRADLLHQAGFKGQGMTIAVIDAGFHNVDKIEAMENIRILGTRDFVNPESDIYAENSHGMAVLSCMAMNRPHVMVGTAPEASYWLLRSEDAYSENLIEQDYWSAAIEFADSVGVDLVNTSLGYYSFDDPTKDYRYRDLNGRYALMSRQASQVAAKGIVLVCSAGNSGAGTWKKITPPGDADNVLTVGAIDKNGVLAPFSSIGNTADGRVKPDVVAVGLGSDVMGTDGNLSRANGTSFSSPIMCGMVACLWQACPKLTAKEIVELVRRSGDRADFPDNIYGYGIPDLWKAYRTANGLND